MSRSRTDFDRSVILSGCRTPFGKLGGGLASLAATDLGGIVIKEAIARAGIAGGGMESMSNAPYLLDEARFGYRLGDGVLIDSMVYDGLTCAVAGVHMGVHGGNVAAEENISREEQDRWALRSHQRAVAATENGVFAAEIVPVEVPGPRGVAVVD